MTARTAPPPVPLSAPLAASLSLLAALTACGPQQGVGFTGIGSEPAGAAAAMQKEAPRVYVPAAGAGRPATASGSLPLHRAAVSGGSEAELAAAAMAAGGNTQQAAQAVMLGAQGVMASVVEAGSRRFLVARSPRNAGKEPFQEGTGRAFLASVQPLTNCGTGQQLFRKEGGTQAAALAVALDCD